MVWHIHFKNGKFAIWSTVVDDYITTWGTAEEIKKLYIEMKIENFKKDIEDDIDKYLVNAKAKNGCCFGKNKKDLEVEERIGRMNRGEEPMVDF